MAKKHVRTTAKKLGKKDLKKTKGGILIALNQPTANVAPFWKMDMDYYRSIDGGSIKGTLTP